MDKLNLNELYDRRDKLIAEMREALRAENVEAFDKLEEEERKVSGLIQRARKIEEHAEAEAEEWLKRQHAAGHKPSTSEAVDYWYAFRRNLLPGVPLTPEERAVLQSGGETRSLLVNPPSSGGYLVPKEFWREVVETMKYYSPMLEVGRVIRTNTGAQLSVPKFDGTSLMASLVNENDQIPLTSFANKFSQLTLGAYKYGAIVTYTIEMLQDAAEEIPSFTRNVMAEMFGRMLSEHFTTGTGVNQPQGFVTGATVGATTAANNAITRIDILNLIHSVDPAYRRSPSCRLVFSDAILRAIKALQIGSNDASPLWVPSMRDGEPDRIEGYPYVINQSMDSLGANKTIMAFGDFSRFWIREVYGVNYQLLSETYAPFGATGIVAIARYDARVADNQAIKLLVTPS